MRKIDLTSPVEILACELPKSDYAACDLTLFNLSGDQVTSVEATLTLQDENGEEIARVIHRARSLNGAPDKAFIMTIPTDSMTRARGWEATIDKVWFDNSSIWRRSRVSALTEYEPNDLEPSNALNNLRAIAGEDAVGYPSEQEGLWVCVCGRPNDNQVPVCARCGRSRAEVFTHCTQSAVEQTLAAHESRLSEQRKQTLADSSAKQLKREEEFKKQRKKRRIIIAATTAVAVLAGGSYVTLAKLSPHMRYTSAIEAFNSGEYQQAEEAFLALEDYANSANYVLQCRYESAKAQLENGSAQDIAAARETFVALGDYQDAAALVSECDYQQALLLLEDSDTENARAMFTALGDYQDSARKVQEIDYQNAAKLLENGDYEQARAAFAALGDMDDALTQIDESWRREALEAINANNPDAALALLENIPNHAETAALTQQAHYIKGTALRAEGNIDEAAASFALAGDYEDAAQQANECFYAPAMEAYANGQYDRAAELLSRIRGYEDADDKWTIATYESAKTALHDLEYNRATELLNALPEDYEDVADLRKECIYRPAMAAYDRGEYETALGMFNQIADYADAAAQIQGCQYAIAGERFKQGDLTGAIELYTQLGDYSDAAKQLQGVQYVQANNYMSLGTAEGYQQAIDAYTALGDYSDSASRLQEALFNKADLLLQSGSHAEAKPIFEELGDYGEAATRIKTCDYAEASDLYAQGKLEDAAQLYLSLEGYEDALTKAKGIWYEMGGISAQAGDILTAARYYTRASDYQDAQALADELYDEYYGAPSAQAQQAYDSGSYDRSVALLKPLDRTDLPPKYAFLPDLYQKACYEAGNKLYDEGQPYAALPYYQEIPGYRNVDSRLQHSCYLILGVWTDLDGVEYAFSPDGTLTIGDEHLYFSLEGMTLRTGPNPDALSDTHRVSGVTLQNAWLFDGRSGTDITIYLTKDEEATAALVSAAAFAEPADESTADTLPVMEEIPIPSGAEE